VNVFLVAVNVVVLLGAVNVFLEVVTVVGWALLLPPSFRDLPSFRDEKSVAVDRRVSA